jgi:hypothetical protein
MKCLLFAHPYLTQTKILVSNSVTWATEEKKAEIP